MMGAELVFVGANAMSNPAMILHNISFAVGGKSILNSIYLRFSPGKITAIIGPSGSGKSTLMKCAASVLEPTGGEVQVGGVPLRDQKAGFRRLLGYVPQDDVIHRELRVQDAFYYAARLRLDPLISDADVMARISEVLRRLQMEPRRNQRISRLSGGQRKRVNIGVELLADPLRLFLDEAASGLDPGTEEDLMNFLAQLAGDGKTVVLTTHSMEHLDRVDQLVLLQGGDMVFAGSMQELLAHFEIAHIAEVFKRLRERPQTHWRGLFKESAPGMRVHSEVRLEFRQKQ